MAIARTHILVCGGTGCSSSHSQALIDELNRELEEKGLLGEVQVIKTGCFGLCALGPVVVVYPEGCFYRRISPRSWRSISSRAASSPACCTRRLWWMIRPSRT